MTNTVRTESAAASSMSQHWPMIRALLGGTSAMRAAGKCYLPRWPNEDLESYDARLKTAVLYPAFARTVEVLAGKPFSKRLTLSEDTPTRIAEWMEDADMQGRNLHTFAADIMTDCIGYGISGVLVDYPTVSNVRNLAEERAVNARPYFTRYAPGTVLGWRTERMNGSTKLTMLRLLEVASEIDGEFGEKEVEQVRVLRPGSWQVWRKVETGQNKQEWAIYDEGINTLPEIPFVFFYGKRKGFGIGVPPLLDLAHMNVEHWQESSDQKKNTHYARTRIVAVFGAEGLGELTSAADYFMSFPSGADIKVVQGSSESVAVGRSEIDFLEERMRSAGAELLVIKPGQITATQTRSEDDGNKSALQSIVEGVEDALDQCLQYAAMWVGEAEGGNVTLFKDFSAGTLAESMKDVISMTVSEETKFREAQRRGIISEDLDWMDEQERMQMQGPALGMAGAV